MPKLNGFGAARGQVSTVRGKRHAIFADTETSPDNGGALVSRGDFDQSDRPKSVVRGQQSAIGRKANRSDFICQSSAVAGPAVAFGVPQPPSLSDRDNNRPPVRRASQLGQGNAIRDK